MAIKKATRKKDDLVYRGEERILQRGPYTGGTPKMTPLDSASKWKTRSYTKTATPKAEGSGTTRKSYTKTATPKAAQRATKTATPKVRQSGTNKTVPSARDAYGAAIAAVTRKKR